MKGLEDERLPNSHCEAFIQTPLLQHLLRDFRLRDYRGRAETSCHFSRRVVVDFPSSLSPRPFLSRLRLIRLRFESSSMLNLVPLVVYVSLKDEI